MDLCTKSENITNRTFVLNRNFLSEISEERKKEEEKKQELEVVETFQQLNNNYRKKIKVHLFHHHKKLMEFTFFAIKTQNHTNNKKCSFANQHQFLEHISIFVTKASFFENIHQTLTDVASDMSYLVRFFYILHFFIAIPKRVYCYLLLQFYYNNFSN